MESKDRTSTEKSSLENRYTDIRNRYSFGTMSNDVSRTYEEKGFFLLPDPLDGAQTGFGPWVAEGPFQRVRRVVVDGRMGVEIEGIVGPANDRQGYEGNERRGATNDKLRIYGAQMGHASPPGLGIESWFGIKLVPNDVNLSVQPQIDNSTRKLADDLASRDLPLFRRVTVFGDGGGRLARQTIDVETVDPTTGERVPLGNAEVIVSKGEHYIGHEPPEGCMSRLESKVDPEMVRRFVGGERVGPMWRHSQELPIGRKVEHWTVISDRPPSDVATGPAIDPKLADAVRCAMGQCDPDKRLAVYDTFNTSFSNKIPESFTVETPGRHVVDRAACESVGTGKAVESVCTPSEADDSVSITAIDNRETPVKTRETSVETASNSYGGSTNTGARETGDGVAGTVRASVAPDGSAEAATVDIGKRDAGIGTANDGEADVSLVVPSETGSGKDSVSQSGDEVVSVSEVGASQRLNVPSETAAESASNSDGGAASPTAHEAIDGIASTDGGSVGPDGSTDVATGTISPIDAGTGIANPGEADANISVPSESGNGKDGIGESGEESVSWSETGASAEPNGPTETASEAFGTSDGGETSAIAHETNDAMAATDGGSVGPDGSAEAATEATSSNETDMGVASPGATDANIAVLGETGAGKDGVGVSGKEAVSSSEAGAITGPNGPTEIASETASTNDAGATNAGAHEASDGMAGTAGASEGPDGSTETATEAISTNDAGVVIASPGEAHVNLAASIETGTGNDGIGDSGNEAVIAGENGAMTAGPVEVGTEAGGPSEAGSSEGQNGFSEGATATVSASDAGFENANPGEADANFAVSGVASTGTNGIGESGKGAVGSSEATTAATSDGEAGMAHGGSSESGVSGSSDGGMGNSGVSAESAGSNGSGTEGSGPGSSGATGTGASGAASGPGESGMGGS